MRNYNIQVYSIYMLCFENMVDEPILKIPVYVVVTHSFIALVFWIVWSFFFWHEPN